MSYNGAEILSKNDDKSSFGIRVNPYFFKLGILLIK